MNLSATQILALGAVAIAGTVVYVGSRKVAAAANAVNPVNNDNIFKRGFDAVLQKTGIIDDDSSLGSSLFDLLNPGAAAYDPNEPIRGPLQ